MMGACLVAAKKKIIIIYFHWPYIASFPAPNVRAQYPIKKFLNKNIPEVSYMEIFLGKNCLQIIENHGLLFQVKGGMQKMSRGNYYALFASQLATKKKWQNATPMAY